MEQWYIYSKKADFAKIANQFHISPMLARIIRNRDIVDPVQIDRFLNGTLEDLYDPFLMKDMEKGARLTADTIAEGGRIRIIGDYDVDGVCSAYVLKTYLEHVSARVDVRLPDRIMEGYGMNEQMAEEAAGDGISLIITCDNGISAKAAIQRARELGIHVIVTDHHEPAGDLPAADAVIDPKQEGCSYPFRELCGCGVAWKFLQALDSTMNQKQDVLLHQLLQFAGMATITDIVPLKDENRIIAAQGIKQLRDTENPGLLALMRERGLEKESLNAGNIGYIIGPCINSAGRLKNAGIAFALLEAKDLAKASELAEELSMLNEERRFLTDAQVKEAFEKLSQIPAEEEQSRVIVLYLPRAHESVAGIVAGRIKDEFHRPAIVVTRSEGGLKGSGRSLDSYNMIDALQQNADLFLRFGGHAKACGFTLKPDGNEEKTVQELSARLNRSCGIRPEDLIKKVWIDMQLPFKYVTGEFIKELQKLEPFGLQNEKPVFAGKDLTVEQMQIVGKNSNVLRLSLRDCDGILMEGVMFSSREGIREQSEALSLGMQVAVLYYPMINEFRGQRTCQIQILSIRKGQA